MRKSGSSEKQIVEFLNEHWFSAIVSKGDRSTTMVVENGLYFTPSAFMTAKTHLEWPRRHGVTLTNLAEYWFTSLYKRHFVQYAFAPGETPGEVTVDRYNSFHGLGISAEAAADAVASAAVADDHKEVHQLLTDAILASPVACAYIEDKVKPLTDHILNIWCKGDQALFMYVVNWLAHLVQKRGVKTLVALVLHGPHGAGKVRGCVYTRVDYFFCCVTASRACIWWSFAGRCVSRVRGKDFG